MHHAHASSSGNQRHWRADWSQPALERTWRTVGMLSMAVGVINAFIPLLPTTVFLLIGVWAYGKGDPAMRERLLNHPRYGRSLRLWIENRQITRRGKLAAVGGIALSAAITATALGPSPVMWFVVAALVGLSAYLATRAEPAPDAA
ncbi:YbaN family protein [uncultured Aquabacterium sp.]|uniref:YbaN family protein n=1 Tax=Aquabacterium sp. TaxID=1872578 RepID=UPI0025D7A849|nr:YbaN family protein [uncultured Aquabacterium sp.]